MMPLFIVRNVQWALVCAYSGMDTSLLWAYGNAVSKHDAVLGTISTYLKNNVVIQSQIRDVCMIPQKGE